MELLKLLNRTKRSKRLDLIERYRRAADSYDEMAELSQNVKPLRWSEYCRLMSAIRRNDANMWEKLL
jgi:hypothetical protein